MSGIPRKPRARVGHFTAREAQAFEAVMDLLDEEPLLEEGSVLLEMVEANEDVRIEVLMLMQHAWLRARRRS
jgi:hypothetical protein